MDTKESLEGQPADLKKTMTEAQWQRLINKSFYEQSLPVAILGGLLGGVLLVVGAALHSNHLSFGAIVGQIGAWTLTLSVFSPIWIGIYAFFRYRKRCE